LTSISRKDKIIINNMKNNMKLFKKTSIGVLVLTFTFGLTGPNTALAATSPTLGTVGSYSVLGHTTVTNTGATTMPGDLGISIGGAPVGFPPGSVGPPGTIRNAGDSLAAQNADTAAFGVLDQGCDTTYAGTKDLVGLNLVPGVYCAGAFALTGTLTLNGGAGNVWIFKSAATLITSGTANVVGGDPCNVWWREVSSTTLGTNTSLIGNILASTSIALQTGASLNGRALAQTGAVTLDTNTITGSACLAASSSGGGSSSSTTVVPKLPNTGAGPEYKGSTPWNTILLAGIVVGLGSLYLVRRKRAI
jgi:Ice-binding-like